MTIWMLQRLPRYLKPPWRIDSEMPAMFNPYLVVPGHPCLGVTRFSVPLQKFEKDTHRQTCASSFLKSKENVYVLETLPGKGSRTPESQNTEGHLEFGASFDEVQEEELVARGMA